MYTLPVWKTLSSLPQMKIEIPIVVFNICTDPVVTNNSRLSTRQYRALHDIGKGMATPVAFHALLVRFPRISG